MKQFNVLAVDDEGPALRRLVKMAEAHPQLRLVGTAKNAMDAKNSITGLKPDILLLDIQLKDATAFEVLSELENNFQGKIIFITAYDKYAVKAFEYEAVDYLLKPFTQERFNAAIERIITKNENTDLKKLVQLLNNKYENDSKMLIVPEGVKNYFIEKDKLHYIYAEGYYANFVMEKEKKLIRISLKKLDGLLPENFIRINKSTIINKDYIVELITNKTTCKVIMPDKNEFYVSHTFEPGFTQSIQK